MCSGQSHLILSTFRQEGFSVRLRDQTSGTAKLLLLWGGKESKCGCVRRLSWAPRGSWADAAVHFGGWNRYRTETGFGGVRTERANRNWTSSTRKTQPDSRITSNVARGILLACGPIWSGGQPVLQRCTGQPRMGAYSRSLCQEVSLKWNRFYVSNWKSFWISISKSNKGSLSSRVSFLLLHQLLIKNKLLFRVPPSKMAVKLGMWALNGTSGTGDMSPPTQIFRVREAFLHYSYDAVTLDNDVALLHLDNQVDLSEPQVCLICLPSQDNYDGAQCTISSFSPSEGNTLGNTSVLSQLDFTVINASSCQSQLVATGKLQNNFRLNGDVTLCAKSNAAGEDTCRGDGGSSIAVSGCRMMQL